MKLAKALLVFFGLLPSLAWAGKDFVFTPEEQEVVYPKLPFNAVVAKERLGPGDCTLRGEAYDRQGSGLLQKKKPKEHMPAGSKIYLFPYTEYCQEVVHLFKEHSVRDTEKSLKTLQAEAQLKAVVGHGIPEPLPVKRVEVDPQFSKIWRSALVDERGHFVFERLKPGRYYLQSPTFMVARDHTYSEQVGEMVQHTYWSNGMVTSNNIPQWASRSATMYHRVELVTVVELSRPGETLEIDLNEDWHDFDAP